MRQSYRATSRYCSIARSLFLLPLSMCSSWSNQFLVMVLAQDALASLGRTLVSEPATNAGVSRIMGLSMLAADTRTSRTAVGSYSWTSAATAPNLVQPAAVIVQVPHGGRCQHDNHLTL